MRKIRKRGSFRRIRKIRKCYFCENGGEPDFTQFENLKKFISDRGKILSRLRTGTCLSHQRKLTKAVKRARFLSLLPFTAKI